MAQVRAHTGSATPPGSERHKLAESVREELWFGDDEPAHTWLSASQSMAVTAATASGLKPFPVVAQRVMKLLSDPDVKATKIRAAVEQDPALAARLLRVANSAVYGASHVCRSIDEAIVRLGSRTVTEIVASAATLGMFADVNGLGLAFRNHCVGVAAIARLLSLEWRSHGVDEIFLCGLLHDVGKLLAMQVGDVHYERMSAKVLHSPDEAHVYERAATGFDHAVLGAHVLELWKLPKEVAEVVAWHHQTGRAFAVGGRMGLAVALLRLADHVEYQLRGERALNEEFIAKLAQDGAASYTQYGEQVLRAMWPKFVTAYDEMVKVK